MKRKWLVRFVVGLAALLLLSLAIVKLIVEPWVEKQLSNYCNAKLIDCSVEFETCHVSIFGLTLKVENILFQTKPEFRKEGSVIAKIAFLELKGIGIFDLLYSNCFTVNEIHVESASVNQIKPFSNYKLEPFIAGFKVKVKKLIFSNTYVSVNDASSFKQYILEKGLLELDNLKFNYLDTLNLGLLENFKFMAEKLVTVSKDSMYTLSVKGLSYYGASKFLSLDSFTIHPNHSDYVFADLHKYQTDRIETALSNVIFNNVDAKAYFKSGSLISSSVIIQKLNTRVFRDKRKEFKSGKMPVFQDMIYDYPAKINIDSIFVVNGNVSYYEHARRAKNPGRISFNSIKAIVYNLSNDTVYKTKMNFLELKSTALLYGKGKFSVHLKSRIYDPNDSFTVVGSLGAIDAREFNPMAERVAFLYISTGWIDQMKFNFNANNYSASGRMRLQYHGLNVTLKNQETNDTTAVRELLGSYLLNLKIMNANPLPGKDIRIGIIDNERDPECFLFHYCYKAILSGVKSSIVKERRSKH